MAGHTFNRNVTIGELADFVGAKIFGARDKNVIGLCAFDEPIKDGLSFTREARPGVLAEILKATSLAGLIVSSRVDPSSYPSSATLLQIDDPIPAIAKIAKHFIRSNLPEPGISSSADIHPTVRLGHGVSVGAYCCIGAGAEIGDNVILYPHVVVYSDVKIGSNSIIHASAVIREGCWLGEQSVIHAGAVIGSDGFGFYLDKERGLAPIPQIGTVNLGKGVEVGANSCVDRATLGTTQIGDGSKLDNLVQVGHNVKVGKSSVLCAGAGIAGSTKIGNGVTIGGNVGVADHLEIVDGCRVGGQAGVPRSLLEKGDYSGYPAVPLSQWNRQAVALKDLPEIAKEFKRAKRKRDD